MRFSIIVPIYNVEKYIRKCLESILMQSFCDYELILINDGSKDQSMRIVQELQNKFNGNIRIIEQMNSGQGAARNKGIRLARGEYLVFVDSDDYLDENFLKKINDEIDEYNPELVCFNAMMVDERDNFIKHYNMCERSMHSISIDKRADILLLPPAIWNKVCSKQLFFRTNCWFIEGHIFEDTVVARALFTQAKSISFLEIEPYYYVQHENSTMSNKKKNLLDIVCANSELLQWFQAKELFERYEYELETIAIRAVLFYALDIENMTTNNQEVQRTMVDFIKNSFSSVEDNKYLSDFEKRKIKVLFGYDFKRYFKKYNRIKKYKIKSKVWFNRIKKFSMQRKKR